jgi:hypothetical protein
MKKISLVILLFLLFDKLNAQNIKGIYPTKSLYFFNNIVYENYYIPDTLRVYCENNKIYKYFIEDLELSEQSFLDLNIKPKDLKEKESTFNYIYRNNDKTNCIEYIRLNHKLKIPIKLNGELLRDDEEKNQLYYLTEDKIISIIKNKSFFRKPFIEIEIIK